MVSAVLIADVTTVGVAVVGCGVAEADVGVGVVDAEIVEFGGGDDLSMSIPAARCEKHQKYSATDSEDRCHSRSVPGCRGRGIVGVILPSGHRRCADRVHTADGIKKLRALVAVFHHPSCCAEIDTRSVGSSRTMR